MPLEKNKPKVSLRFDLRAAINAVSDVVENRPRPLREFDQIYMKVADMVIQAYLISERLDGLDVVFIGDGDAIGLSMMHLKTQGIFKFAPKNIHLLDFDERIVNSVTRFASDHGFSSEYPETDSPVCTMSASLYNVVNPVPDEHFGKYDAFYTNPPWGASNAGESVKVFMERGMEATNSQALGVLVIADDPKLPWTQEVLQTSQKMAVEKGFIVGEMVPELHVYHLDDNPDLRSCTCVFRRLKGAILPSESTPLDPERCLNFYGADAPLNVRYVREVPTLNVGKAPDGTYTIEPLEV